MLNSESPAAHIPHEPMLEDPRKIHSQTSQTHDEQYLSFA